MWDWFIQFMTDIMVNLDRMTGDLGLAIIILTVIIRILIMPLMTRSTASTARMQALQPMMREIQEKYAGDPERQNRELQKFYAEHKFNPLGGCLPVLLQMPIFFCFFTATRQITDVAATEGLSTSFFNIIPDLSQTVGGAVAEVGFPGALVYLLLDVLFGLLTLIPLVMNLRSQPEEQRQQSLTMGIMMSVMMLWFGWSVPCAVLLYYNTSAVWQVIQQQLVTKRVTAKIKAETEAQLQSMPHEISVERRERKPRPKKKG